MKDKHTPGPWYYHKYGNQTEVIIASTDGKFIGEVFELDWNKNRVWNETARANSQLVAVAPDMLAVLKVINSWLGEDHPSKSEVRRVIARATGRDEYEPLSDD